MGCGVINMDITAADVCVKLALCSETALRVITEFVLCIKAASCSDMAEATNVPFAVCTVLKLMSEITVPKRVSSVPCRNEAEASKIPASTPTPIETLTPIADISSDALAINIGAPSTVKLASAVAEPKAKIPWSAIALSDNANSPNISQHLL